jgi:hypothetical protein
MECAKVVEEGRAADLQYDKGKRIYPELATGQFAASNCIS